MNGHIRRNDECTSAKARHCGLKGRERPQGRAQKQQCQDFSRKGVGLRIAVEPRGERKQRGDFIIGKIGKVIEESH
jgi:hypothetical protein